MVDDVASRKTYRYARLGMIGAVVLLGSSILLEHNNVAGRNCWQTSISAYYYTPTRAIFVGVLMAIGLSLIVIKGSTWQEDLCLNAAGMLAPIVALVPTSDAGDCYSIAPVPLPTIDNPKGDDPLQEWVIRNIDNNIEALLIAGTVGLVAAALIAAASFGVGKRRGGPDQPQIKDAWSEENRGTLLGVVMAAAMLGLAAYLYFGWSDFHRRSHGFAAMAMFGMLAVAALVNAWQCWQLYRRAYLWIYLSIGVSMAGVALLMLLDSDDWAHKVLWVELLEITLFAAFWTVQTRELWHNTVRPRAVLPAGVLRTVDVDGVAAPWYATPFDKHGDCTAPETRAHLCAADGPFTDVFLFSHGWNNDGSSALAQYTHFVEGYCGTRARLGWDIDREFRPLLVGVLWPSAILVLPGERGPDMAAAGGPASDQSIDVVAAELAPADAARLRQLAAKASPDPADWQEVAALLAPLYAADAEDGDAPAPDESALLGQWTSSRGRFDVDPDPVVGPGRAPVVAAPAAAGLFGTVRDAIRQTTVWLMKDRAGHVGARGVGPLLRELLEKHPQARFHLIGHSYGCKVLLSAICSEPPPRQVTSLLLLQAAISAECFSADRGDGRPGGYRSALTAVQQPIIATFSKDDVSLRRWFHVFLRRAGDEGDLASAADDNQPPRFAALGGWGPVGADADTARITMPAPGTAFPATPAVGLVAVDATGAIRGHGDISNEATWWSLHESVTAP